MGQSADKVSSSVAMLNYLPIIGQAIQLVASVLFSGLSDYFNKRLPFLLVHSVGCPEKRPDCDVLSF